MDIVKRKKCLADTSAKSFGGDLKAPCFGLVEVLNEPYSTGAGIVTFGLLWMDQAVRASRKTRQLVSIRSGKHRKRGMIANYCPFCGERLFDTEIAKMTARPKLRHPLYDHRALPMTAKPDGKKPYRRAPKIKRSKS